MYKNLRFLSRKGTLEKISSIRTIGSYTRESSVYKFYIMDTETSNNLNNIFNEYNSKLKKKTETIFVKDHIINEERKAHEKLMKENELLKQKLNNISTKKSKNKLNLNKYIKNIGHELSNERKKELIKQYGHLVKYKYQLTFLS